MTKSRNIAPPRHVWTAADLAYMREHYADTPTAQIAQALGVDIPRVYAAAQHHGLSKSHTFLTSTASGRIGRYGGRGAEHQFRAGQSVRRWPKELAELVQLRGVLTRAINSKAKEQERAT